jgi:hypothetical protein
MRKCPEAHWVQQQSTVTAGGTGSARAGVACTSSTSAPGSPIASVSALQSNLLLLTENLDLGGGEAKRGVGNRGYGHLVRAETCSKRDSSLGCTSRSQCGWTGRTEVHDANDQDREESRGGADCGDVGVGAENGTGKVEVDRENVRGEGTGSVGEVARGQCEQSRQQTDYLLKKWTSNPLRTLIWHPRNQGREEDEGWRDGLMRKRMDWIVSCKKRVKHTERWLEEPAATLQSTAE